MTDSLRDAPRSPAPSQPSFSERVQRLANFADAHCGEDELLMLLVRAIREQQAALAGVIRVADRATDEFDAARAVLEKWRIE